MVARILDKPLRTEGFCQRRSSEREDKKGRIENPRAAPSSVDDVRSCDSSSLQLRSVLQEGEKRRECFGECARKDVEVEVCLGPSRT